MQHNYEFFSDLCFAKGIFTTSGMRENQSKSLPPTVGSSVGVSVCRSVSFHRSVCLSVIVSLIGNFYAPKTFVNLLPFASYSMLLGTKREENGRLSTAFSARSAHSTTVRVHVCVRRFIITRRPFINDRLSSHFR